MRKKVIHPVEKGDNVLVIVAEDHKYYGTNGIVTKVHKKSATVKCIGKKAFDFSFEQVQKINLEDYPAIRAIGLFSKFETVTPLQYKFSPENMCMYKDCNNHAAKRILFCNKQTDVHEYDVCETHASLDGWQDICFKGKQYYEALYQEPK
jgi:ribosomal protein L24